MNVIATKGRITARVSQPIENKLLVAAELVGATLNQFLVQAALEKAEKIIDREKLIHFSQDDAVLFIQMLENPKKPNDALKKAFERHKKKNVDESNYHSAG